MAVSLDSSVLDQLNTAQARALHDLTNELSACGVGDIVNLPQIIVVGEQSAGKSSVLEAISHVRFPVNADICTRFATELVLHHSKGTRVDVSVRFADKSKASQEFQRKGFHEDDLPGIIKEATERMGITATGKGFSKDVLRLEIGGPNMLPLTLVDLPGLFHNDTEKQSLGGKEMVDQLVESYMKEKKSIILVVIPASNQIASHISLRKMKQYDPQLERTLGVITKPDLARPGYTDEKTYIQLAKNQESSHKLTLGWHVLRNRAEDEDSMETRDATEAEFFPGTAWASVPPEDLGVANLRKKLSKVLYNHIRNNLDDVIKDTEDKLSERQDELDRLGLSRSTHREMRSFLVGIAAEFQRLVRDGIYGSYNDRFFGDLRNAEYKLRAQLRNFNRAFDHVLATKGSKLALEPRDASAGLVPQVPDFLKNFLGEYPYDFDAPTSISRGALNIHIEQRAAVNQGRELPGSHNSDLVIQLFQVQSSPWKGIADFHIKQVTLVAKAFVDNLLRHVIGQPDTNPTTEAILRGCVDPFFTEKESLLSQKLEELLEPFARGYAMPQDAEFRQMVTRRTIDRLAEQLRVASEKHEEQSSDLNAKNRRTDVLADAALTLEAADGGDFATDKVIDMMEAYYEMSRRTFTDNVTNLAIESCLISALPEILTPTQVDKMDDKQLEELAAESEYAQSRRERLHAEIEVLRRGLEQCRKYKPRGMTVLPSKSTQSSTKPTSLFGQPPVPAPAPAPAPAGSIFGSAGASAKPDKATVSNAASKFGGFASTTKPSSGGGFGGFAPSSSSGALGSVPSSTPKPSSGSLFGASPWSAASDPGSSGTSATPSTASGPNAAPRSDSPLSTQKPLPSFDSLYDGSSLFPKNNKKLNTEFHPYSESGGYGDLSIFKHICCAPGFKGYSPEELRLDDYQEMKLSGEIEALKLSREIEALKLSC